jgi:hypothetical protein
MAAGATRPRGGVLRPADRLAPVIHIATLHSRDPRWIDIQLRRLERYTREPYRTYASLEHIDDRHRSRFDHTLDHSGQIQSRKAGKLGPRLVDCLSRLTADVIERADADDLLVFMHSDAFPVTDWVDPVRRILDERPLVAVRRDEIGEPIPHWCFCVTTAGFWTEIGGDWSRGPTWDDHGQQVTDMGTGLWQNLERRGIAWQPILRTNEIDLHPVFFGVYGDLVYHHGAWSHTAMTRRDAREYSHLPVPLRNFAGVRKRIANTRLSRRMFRRIRRDEHFYLTLTGK